MIINFRQTLLEYITELNIRNPIESVEVNGMQFRDIQMEAYQTDMDYDETSTSLTLTNSRIRIVLIEDSPEGIQFEFR